jgi:D-alanine-D-alanine ligase
VVILKGFHIGDILISMLSHHVRVGVLRGGLSDYEASLQSGADILSALREYHADTYHPHDIFIDKEGVWHMNGRVVRPDEALSKIDIAFNSLHGTYGEDGKVQHVLELYGMPFTGTGALGSAVGTHKGLKKSVLSSHGIKVPRWIEIRAQEIIDDPSAVARKLFQTWHLPLVIKPLRDTSAHAMLYVRSYGELPEALTRAGGLGDVLVEEFVSGIEAVGHIVEGFRGHELYALPVVEMHTTQTGEQREVVPAGFSAELKRQVEDTARSVHQLLGLKHYSQTRMVIHPRRGIHVIEVQTLPHLTKTSLVARALDSVGATMHEFAGHVVSLANKAKNRV